MKRFRLLDVRIKLLLLALAFTTVACHKAVPVAPVAAAPAPAQPPQPPPAGPAITLSADRTIVTAGQSLTLSWQSSNSNTVSLDNGIGTVPARGSRQITPQSSTTYVATARGAGGVATSSPLRISVNPVPAPAAARAAAPPAVRPVPLSEQFQRAIQNILFDYDQARIRDSEIPKLRNNANWLKQNPAVQFTIGGHADERGSQEYNIALGDERAVAIKKYLASEGISENRMMTVSYGEERPLCMDESEECWQKNRVGQFILNP